MNKIHFPYAWLVWFGWEKALLIGQFGLSCLSISHDELCVNLLWLMGFVYLRRQLFGCEGRPLIRTVLSKDESVSASVRLGFTSELCKRLWAAWTKVDKVLTKNGDNLLLCLKYVMTGGFSLTGLSAVVESCAYLKWMNRWKNKPHFGNLFEFPCLWQIFPNCIHINAAHSWSTYL